MVTSEDSRLTTNAAISFLNNENKFFREDDDRITAPKGKKEEGIRPRPRGRLVPLKTLNDVSLEQQVKT